MVGVSLAANFGSPVIAEGVEELADLDLVTSVGINLVQGYLLSEPLDAADLVAGAILPRGVPAPSYQ